MTVTRELLDGVDRLDPLPITVQNLVTKLGDEFPNPREITEIIEYDPAISATVLRAANSAALGGRARIERVGDAVGRLGLDRVLNLALGQHFKKMSAPAELYDLDESDFFLHGAVSSIAAKEIMAACPTVNIPRIAPVAALMHDIGKLVLIRHVESDMEELTRHARENEVTFVEAEQALFGFDHAEIGAIIAEKWSFPIEVNVAIALHHQVPVIRPSPLLDTVMLANVIAKTIGVGLGAEGLNMHADDACLKRLGLGFSAFGRICSEVISGMDGLKQLYGA